MKKAIYKITNKINHKVYIGQAIDPEKRFREHCWKHENYISLINNAIQKYGEENFTFEVLGWYEDYNDKEREFISLYNSRSPYGYNIQPGGEEPPHPKGEEHPLAKLTNQQVQEIKKDMKDFSLTEKQILQKHKITKSQFRHIKDGTAWKDENETYPLRPSEAELNERKADKVIELLQTTQITQKEIGKMVGWNRSAITMINIGRNHYRSNIDYPIRK